MSVLCPSELIQRYREGRLIPFIGAGLSSSVSWQEEDTIRAGPSWAQLVDRAAEMLGFQDPELLRVRGTDLQILEYYRLRKGNEFAELRNWLYSSVRPPDEALKSSIAHEALAQLARCTLYYTTNYDDFIERSLMLNDRTCRTIATEAHMGEPRDAPDTCEVVKFHGDLNSPDVMVLSESDYERRLTLTTPMDYRLRADVLGKVILFLGYSFRDWNVSYLFRLVTDQFRNLPGSLSGRRAYITVADPSDFELRLFANRNIEVIPIHGGHMTEDMGELLTKLTE